MMKSLSKELTAKIGAVPFYIANIKRGKRIVAALRELDTAGRFFENDGLLDG